MPSRRAQGGRPDRRSANRFNGGRGSGERMRGARTREEVHPSRGRRDDGRRAPDGKERAVTNRKCRFGGRHTRSRRYHIVRGRFGQKDYDHPRSCEDARCTRRHWRAGTGPAYGQAAGPENECPNEPNALGPRVWRASANQMNILLNELLSCSHTFVETIADAFHLGRQAKQAMRKAQSWEEIRDILAEQGVIGIGEVTSRRGQFWEIVQQIIDQEAEDVGPDLEVDLRAVLRTRQWVHRHNE